MTQTTSVLHWSVDGPEGLLRLLLQETETDRILEPPEDYDPETQGKWDTEFASFGFRKPFELIKVEQVYNYLYLEYKFGVIGHWFVEIQPEKMTIARI
jgi:hypothetical protein